MTAAAYDIARSFLQLEETLLHGVVSRANLQAFAVFREPAGPVIK